MSPLELLPEQGEAAHHEQDPRSRNAGEREEAAGQHEHQADEYSPGSNGVPDHEIERILPARAAPAQSRD
jgi:hypothetical protein